MTNTTTAETVDQLSLSRKINEVISPINEYLNRKFGFSIDIYDVKNSGPECLDGIFKDDVLIAQLSEQMQSAWSVPPYNEHLVHKSVRGTEYEFDPPKGLKVGRNRSPEEASPYHDSVWKDQDERQLYHLTRQPNYDENDWELFWSEERVRLYIEQGMQNPNFKAIIIRDNEGNLVSWTLGYEVNPLDLLDNKVIAKNKERVQVAYYFDTIGFSTQYRDGSDKNKKHQKSEIQFQMALALLEIAKIFDGNLITRTHTDAKNVGRMLQGFGFRQMGVESKIDSERIYWLKVLDGEFSIQDFPHRLESRSWNNPAKKLSAKAQLYLFDLLEKRLTTDGIDENDRAALEEIRNEILNYTFGQRIQSEIIPRDFAQNKQKYLIKAADLAAVPISTALAIAAYGHIAANNTWALLPLGLFEALPLGGLAAFNRTLYFLATLTFPEILKDIQNETYSKKRAREHVFRGISTFWDGGWAIIPFIRDPKYYAISEIIIDDIVSNLVTMGSAATKKLMKQFQNIGAMYEYINKEI